MLEPIKSVLGKGSSFHIEFAYSVWWNLFLITCGTVITAVAVKSLAVPYEFMAGGVFGLASLIYYITELLSPGWIYFLLSIPLFIFAWVKVSRRFFWYSLYATFTTTAAYELLTIPMPVHNELYAAVACGALVGLGSGIVLRSLGSNGGLDVLAVYLFQRFNIGIGKVYIIFNAVIFSLSLTELSLDVIIASFILVFISSVVVDQTLSMFSQRKVVFIISKSIEMICHDILHEMKQSATFIKGQGAYLREDTNILMTVVNNIQLKKLEEIAFRHDEKVLLIVENTFSVMGSSFSRRKVY
ncbi:YitT family protein [Maridesulfovibrio zosterae]|uniref:YitT family protein n=1 Tax=Maridesulfovibrio zosterae TaxID=82171 RepID=UPI000414A19E|nr:YitT family protein [Maridesulfovibrio zosterae]